MEKLTVKESAEKVRWMINHCSDEEVMFFAHCIFSESFETVEQHVKRKASEYKKELPF